MSTGWTPFDGAGSGEDGFFHYDDNSELLFPSGSQPWLPDSVPSFDAQDIDPSAGSEDFSAAQNSYGSTSSTGQVLPLFDPDLAMDITHIGGIEDAPYSGHWEPCLGDGAGDGHSDTVYLPTSDAPSELPAPMLSPGLPCMRSQSASSPYATHSSPGRTPSPRSAVSTPVTNYPGSSPMSGTNENHRFRCDQPECDRHFTKSNDLKRHKREVHPMPGDPRYRCRCDYPTTRKENFSRHVRRCKITSPNPDYKCICDFTEVDKNRHLAHVTTCQVGYQGRPGRPPTRG